MNKKISEIAKELDVKPGVILKKLKDLGLEADNIASSLSLEEQNRLYESMGIRKGITTRKVTKVTTDGNVVSKKKVIIKVPGKAPGDVDKDKSNFIVSDESSDLMSGMVRGAKTLEKPAKKAEKAKEKEEPAVAPEPVAAERPKLKVTVIRKHKDEEPAADAGEPVPQPDAPQTQDTKPESGDMPEKGHEAEPAKTMPVEEKKTVLPKETAKPSYSAGPGTHRPSKYANNEPARKLGLTGKKIDMRPDKPGIPDAPADIADLEAGNQRPNKKIEKVIYKKTVKIDDKPESRDKKAPVNKVASTGSKTQKYRNNPYVGGLHKVNEVLSEDFILNEYYSDDNIRRRRSKRKGDVKPRREILTRVKLPETMTVKHFAETIKKQSSDVITKLMSLDVIASINDEIDFDTASLVAGEYRIEAVLEAKVTEEDILFKDDEEETEDNMIERAPVVVVMGHVDHGKTSLLDTIKNTDVVATEAGAITQHVGAYSVRINGKAITFLDTPGHEAFTSMRRRGAQVTDIAIIVVAADDGIMPQTVEALNHAKEAGVSIIVAINKIDLPAANPDRVKQELTEYGVVPEEWGGDVICVPVSAKTGENVSQLLEMVLLAADVLELKANPDSQAKGTVIEAKLDAHKGVVTTMLVQKGTLRVGDCVISGYSVGRIRAMENDKGEPLEEAGPSTPAVVVGLDEVPGAGETFYAVDDERTARSLADRRRFDMQQQRTARKPATLDELFNQIQEGSVKELKIIVKGDVRGSVEAVSEALEKLSNEEVSVKVIHGAAGTISESDISLAEVSGAIVIGFNVRPGNNVTEAAKAAGVDIRLYRIIYNAVEDVEAAMKGMLDPKYKEVVTGHAEIRHIFKVSGIGTIGGCMVTDGSIKRNSDVRVVRDGIVVYEGRLASLKRFQDDAKEVQSGYECGMSVEKYNDIKENDVIEAYEMAVIKE
ncbi:MAG: translation initiation factor IF-2 [Clostridia bacterium]|nr:translation initiation factor IF-2 [Clostridia bacterium]